VKRVGRSGAFLTILAAFTAALLCLAGSASAAAPRWKLESLADTATTSPSPFFEYIMDVDYIGDVPSDGSRIDVSAELPTGLVAKQAVLSYPETAASYPCVGVTTLLCSSNDVLAAHAQATASVLKLRIVAEAESGLSGTLVARFAVSGGGASTATTVDPTLVLPGPSPFGIDAFDTKIIEEGGAPSVQAGIHPFVDITSFDLNTLTNPQPLRGLAWPVEPLRDVRADLPPGLLANPSVAPKCTLAQLSNTDVISVFSPRPECDAASQVGVITTRIRQAGAGLAGVDTIGPYPLFDVDPPPGVPGRIGFNLLGTVVVLDGKLRSSGDYGISVTAVNIPAALGVVGNRVEFWGDPSASSHDRDRACPGAQQPVDGGPTCAGAPEPEPFLRNPTSCTNSGEGLATSFHADSWVSPGVFDEAISVSHQAPGYPYPPFEWGAPVGIEECAAVPFDPTLTARPTTDVADSPSGLHVDLSMPQQGFEEMGAISESDLRAAAVTLPQGMSVNPSAASGQGACTASQIGLTTSIGATPIHFSEAPAQCPPSSKVGSVEIETPLLDHNLHGAVYLAKQQDNPFSSLLALYIIVEDERSGVLLKLPGRVVANEETGRLETVFDENPQLPFEHLKVDLFGGSRAALRTPPACGTYATTATLTPWSGNASVDLSSSFQITSGCGGGFDPRLSAGTQNPLAATYSPFFLRLTREDGTQEIGALQAILPPGLIGKPAGIPYCSDATLAAISGAVGTGAAQEAAPSCPAASQLGTVTVGAGAGPTPFYSQSGEAYLAGPYKGAPLSLAVVTPAVAGPFDLGSVVVRNALRIDPQTAQVTAVSDPLPSILHGIPLDLRDIRVDLGRPGFTLNPTSCDPMAIGSTVTSLSGATASPSVRFQAAGCDRLAFKPKLVLKLKGGTKRGDNPALKAILTMPAGNANIGRIQVALPHSEFLDQAHISTVCTRVQFAAGGGGGAACPPGSIYGKATATTPLLDGPLAGNVYLRSSSHQLPDLVVGLHGPPSQPVQVEAVGRIDSIHGGIRTTFATVPDAPLSKVVLSFPAGRKGLLENSTDLCKARSKATVQADAHNGKINDFRAPLQAKCLRTTK
jgi:hypothetical protein